jgi:Arc/MetJ-type ribon-helix-helix transcriptional regulator
MELKARQKSKKSQKTEQHHEVSKPSSSDTNHDYTITLQFNTLLYTTLQNMISSAHTSNDFTYASVADVIRTALQAYADGMELRELDEKGERRNISIRMTKSQHDFYKSLPSRMGRKLVERAVRTFLKNQ